MVDYKTNLLGEPGTPLTSADYGRTEMAGAMLHSHYPLQALLYSVVLHRYLRWRLPAYDPTNHLGGVLYLFLRGMCGPETPQVDGHVAGVFDWSPSGGARHRAQRPAGGRRMIEPFETEDPHDRRFALSLTGVLARFNAAGVVEASDAHAAHRIQALAAEPDDEVALALALAVRSLRHGSVCLELTGLVAEPLPDGLAWPGTGWVERVAASRLAEVGAVRVEGDVLYLDRYWREECQVRDDLVARLRPALRPWSTRRDWRGWPRSCSTIGTTSNAPPRWPRPGSGRRC